MTSLWLHSPDNQQCPQRRQILGKDSFDLETPPLVTLLLLEMACAINCMPVRLSRRTAGDVLCFAAFTSKNSCFAQKSTGWRNGITYRRWGKESACSHASCLPPRAKLFFLLVLAGDAHTSAVHHRAVNLDNGRIKGVGCEVEHAVSELMRKTVTPAIMLEHTWRCSTTTPFGLPGGTTGEDAGRTQCAPASHQSARTSARPQPSPPTRRATPPAGEYQCPRKDGRCRETR